jgi:hypothetical protein
MVCGERSRQRCPHIAGRPETVQKHDRRALTSDSGVDGCAICFNLSALEGGGKKHQIVTAVVEAHFVLQL